MRNKLHNNAINTIRSHSFGLRKAVPVILIVERLLLVFINNNYVVSRVTAIGRKQTYKLRLEMMAIH